MTLSPSGNHKQQDRFRGETGAPHPHRNKQSLKGNHTGLPTCMDPDKRIGSRNTDVSNKHLRGPRHTRPHSRHVHTHLHLQSSPDTQAFNCGSALQGSGDFVIGAGEGGPSRLKSATLGSPFEASAPDGNPCPSKVSVGSFSKLFPHHLWPEDLGVNAPGRR